jgi:hypothetical protein
MNRNPRFSSALPPPSGGVEAKFLFFAYSTDLRFFVIALTPPQVRLCFSVSEGVR